MRRSFFPFFLSLFLSVSCISPAPEGDSDSFISYSGPIAVRSGSVVESSDSYFVSQKMAELFISSQKENPEIVSIEPYGMDGITCLYVINFESGYKIVAADTRVQPILAECEEGRLSPSETDNTGVKVWLEDTADRIRVLKKYNPKVPEDYSDLWLPYRSQEESVIQTRATRDSSFFEEDFIWIRVVESSIITVFTNANQSALMTTKWGQGDPWNAKMPIYTSGYSCVTGCAAVAVSQVLRYFNKKGNNPTALYHSVSVSSTTPYYVFYTINGYLLYRLFLNTNLSRSNYTSPSSRWNDMPDTRYGSHTKYVSRLMLDIGNRINVHYSDLFSFVDPDTINFTYSIPNLSQCGISSSYAPYDFSSVETDINAKKPVIVSAYSDSTQIGLSGGHTWVIDGCHDYLQYYITTETYYYIPSEDYYSYSNVVDVYTDDEMMSINPNVYNGMQNVSSSTHTVKDLHMNWGWDGNGDGYYNMLNGNDWLLPSGDTTLNYLYGRRMHYNISTNQLPQYY